MREFHPGFGQAVPTERSYLSDDPDTAVAQTIQRMAIYAREDSRAAAIQRLAGQLRGPTIDDTIFRVWTWIRARVRFVQDSELAAPISDNTSIAEVLIRPIDLIRMQDAQEDCDGFSMLGAALFLALGVPCYFVTVAADPHSPDQFSHVYLWVNGAAFDASHGRYLGWEAQNRFGKRQLWSVKNGMPVMRSRGLRGIGDCSNPNPDTLQCPDGSYATSAPAPASTSTTLSFPYYTGMPPVTGGGGGTSIQTNPAAPQNFWDALTGQGVSAALAILKARYAVPPPGTLISTPGGFISTAGAPGTSSLALSTAGAFGSSIPSIVWIAGAGLVLLMVLKRK